MQPNPLPLKAMSTLPHNLRQPGIKRIRKPNMTNHTALEERKRPNPLCAIDDLVRDHEIPGLDRLLQTAYGGKGDDGADA